MSNTEYLEYLKTDTWKQLAEKRRKIDDYSCVMCGSRGTSSNPLECHHLNYKNIYHEDAFSDLVTVCHCCHKALHRAMERKTSADGKRGWKDQPGVPKIHVYIEDDAVKYIEEF